jgi:hypothetical protein
MNNSRKISLYFGSIIILIIVCTPYLLYIHQNIPDDLTSYDTIFGTIRGGYYEVIVVYVYVFFSKFVPFLLLLIWFITCKHWWAHAILIPLSVYFIQMIDVVNDGNNYLDEVTFIYSVPILTIVIVIMYFIRSKMSVYIQAVDLKREMDDNMKASKKFGSDSKE